MLPDPVSMAPILARYHVAGTAEEAAHRARGIAYEQTVELPFDLVDDPDVLAHVVGDVLEVTPVAGREDLHEVTIAFAAHLASGQISQLVNLVYGNVSLWTGVRLVGLELPNDLVAALPGPGFGIDGLRRLLGVGGRPLLATAVKPRGSSIEHLAGLAGAFAAGGGDVVKDDQNLNDRDFATWIARISRCAEAVAEANARHGGHCLYMPHVAGPLDEMERRLEAVVRLGLRGVLVAPMIVGLDATAHLVRRHGLLLLAHPAAAGGALVGADHGMEPALLLGTLFRLAGADVSIFPNANGRFRFTREQCLEIARALRRPLGSHVASAPSPAGGMDYDRLPDMARDFDADTVLLVGGALLGAREHLADETRRYLDRIREDFEETSVAGAEVVSACEWEAASGSVGAAVAGGIDPIVARQITQHLRFREDFAWEGRSSARYKDSAELPFRGVRRVELVGQYGERTAFDLRYFEVEPGGFTSLEKHVHTHTLIVARGRGVLVRGRERTELSGLDVAYVGPLEVHQLRNESREPFGFFCIVDHDRDRPQAP